MAAITQPIDAFSPVGKEEEKQELVVSRTQNKKERRPLVWLD